MGFKVVVAAVVAVGVLVGRAGAADLPSKGRFSLIGQKMLAPQTRMSEAGIRYSLTKRLKLDLSYERTGYAPMMPFDHDNGIMTSFRIGF